MTRRGKKRKKDKNNITNKNSARTDECHLLTIWQCVCKATEKKKGKPKQQTRVYPIQFGRCVQNVRNHKIKPDQTPSIACIVCVEHITHRNRSSRVRQYQFCFSLRFVKITHTHTHTHAYIGLIRPALGEIYYAPEFMIDLYAVQLVILPNTRNICCCFFF